MKILNQSLSFSTRGEIDFTDLTRQVEEIVRKSGVKNWLVHVLIEHEPSLLNDLKVVLEKLIPKRGSYQHPIQRPFSPEISVSLSR
jgi:thiamine phosphate synthase YjbQ (UPF0047 family)